MPSAADERVRPTRRALVIGIVIAAFLAVLLALGTLWLSNVWSAEPEPAPTSPVVEEQDSSVPAEEAPAEEAPATVPAEQTPAEDVAPADTVTGGNDNSGPGNNNGNGNGNGPGSNSGKGNGNGNR
ncbi:hypothetical protein ACLBXX_17225 [Microbacterium sp. C23T]